jgi:hypothetical protein
LFLLLSPVLTGAHGLNNSNPVTLLSQNSKSVRSTENDRRWIMNCPHEIS